MPNKVDLAQVDEILSRVEQGELQPGDVNRLRETVRTLTTEDPVLALLSKSLERQAESMERIPHALADLQDNVNKTLTRNNLVFGVIALILMAGLTGARVALEYGHAALSVNQAAEAVAEAPSPAPDPISQVETE